MTSYNMFTTFWANRSDLKGVKKPWLKAMRYNSKNAREGFLQFYVFTNSTIKHVFLFRQIRCHYISYFVKCFMMVRIMSLFSRGRTSSSFLSASILFSVVSISEINN